MSLEGVHRAVRMVLRLRNRGLGSVAVVAECESCIHYALLGHPTGRFNGQLRFLIFLLAHRHQAYETRLSCRISDNLSGGNDDHR
ncbi:hypothetical protein CC2G_013545 [Coprinopsis cinerea AmutBmut pab1-1]|nr:hypothetical protein CC2G_013545 [Coprinopsis cinerea AmutBmut pab1-1]